MSSQHPSRRLRRKDESVNKGEDLVIELEPGDKPLTVRNQLNPAAESLGLDNLKTRWKGNLTVAHQAPGE